MIRAVFDTNILISAILCKGKPRDILSSVIERKIVLVLSRDIIEEFALVIKRRKFGLAEDEQRLLVEFIIKLADVIETKSSFNEIKDDQNDNMVLNCAFDGRVNFIVSGNHHLLDLKEFKGIKIITADEMLKIINLFFSRDD